MTTTMSSASSASRMRWESGSECTGFADSTISARKRSGWSVRISSGMAAHGMRPVMIRWPVTGRHPGGAARPAAAAERLANRVWMFMPPGTPKLPVRR